MIVDARPYIHVFLGEILDRGRETLGKVVVCRDSLRPFEGSTGLHCGDRVFALCAFGGDRGNYYRLGGARAGNLGGEVRRYLRFGVGGALRLGAEVASNLRFGRLGARRLVGGSRDHGGELVAKDITGAAVDVGERGDGDETGAFFEFEIQVRVHGGVGRDAKKARRTSKH